MMSDDWKYDASDTISLRHGEFGGRLKHGAIATTESIGCSMWHLLALKALAPYTQQQFLESAVLVNNDLLIDDIRESMAVLDCRFESDWNQWAHYRSKRNTWISIVNRTAWMTPLEICVELNQPLILWPEWWQFSPRLHPVVQAAQAESLRLIN